jgi:hypothetical protein
MNESRKGNRRTSRKITTGETRKLPDKTGEEGNWLDCGEGWEWEWRTKGETLKKKKCKTTASLQNDKKEELPIGPKPRRDSRKNNLPRDRSPGVAAGRMANWEAADRREAPDRREAADRQEAAQTGRTAKGPGAERLTMTISGRTMGCKNTTIVQVGLDWYPGWIRVIGNSWAFIQSIRKVFSVEKADHLIGQICVINLSLKSKSTIADHHHFQDSTAYLTF